MNVLRCCIAAVAVFASGTVGAGRIDIVSEAQAAQLWTPDPAQKLFVAGYPEAAADKSRDVCVSIGFLINADGSTSNFTQMKAWGSGSNDLNVADAQPYVQIAAVVVSRWKFVPVAKAHQIYTAATFAFDGSKTLGEAGIRERCRIDDLPTFVAEAKRRTDSRGDLNRARADRMREHETQVEAMGNGQY